MKRIFYSLVLLTFFACTENEDISTPLDKKVEAEVEPLTLDESFTNIYGNIGANDLSTRVVIDYLRHPIQFNWSSGDIIGVFPLNATFSNGESAQVQFKAYNGVNNNMVNVPTYPSVPFTEFNPGAFGLVNGCEYAAYYPWAGKNNKTNEIEFDYSYLSDGVEEVYGQPVKTGEKIMERTQVHNHCYMIADAVKPVDDITVFHFEHVGAMVGFHFNFIKKEITNIYNTTNGDEMEEITNVKIWLIDGNGKKVKFPGYALGNLNIPNNREHRSDNVSLNSTQKVSKNDLDHLNLNIKSGVYHKFANDMMDIMLWLYPQDITGLNFLVIAESKKGRHIQHYGTILTGDKQLKSGVAYAFNAPLYYLDEEMNLATIFKEYNIVNNMNAAAFLDIDDETFVGYFFRGEGN